MGDHPDVLRIRFAILAIVMDAVENGHTLHSNSASEHLADRYPDCALTPREIEDAIIMQIGIAKGTVEFGLAHRVF